MYNTTDAYNVTFEATAMRADAKNALEAIVDKFGLPRTLEMLSEIAEEKASHLTENWQEPGQSKVYISVSNKIDTCALSVRTRMEKYYGKMS